MKISLVILTRIGGLILYLAAAAFGSLYYYGLVGHFPNGFISQFQNRGHAWQKRVWDTYTYLLFSLILSAVSVLCSFQPSLVLDSSSTILLLALLGLAFMTVLPYSLKTTFAIVNFLVIGPAISSLGPYFISLAAGYTLVLATLLTLTALLIPTDLHRFMSTFMIGLYIAVTVATVIILLVGLPSNWVGLALLCTSLYGGIILYCGMFLINTQFIFRETQLQQIDPQRITLNLYLCSLHLFFRLSMYLILNRMVTHEQDIQ